MLDEKFGKEITVFATFREMLNGITQVVYDPFTPDNRFCLRDAELLEDAAKAVRTKLAREKARPF